MTYGDVSSSYLLFHDISEKIQRWFCAGVWCYIEYWSLLLHLMSTNELTTIHGQMLLENKSSNWQNWITQHEISSCEVMIFRQGDWCSPITISRGCFDILVCIVMSVSNGDTAFNAKVPDICIFVRSFSQRKWECVVCEFAVLDCWWFIMRVIKR